MGGKGRDVKIVGLGGRERFFFWSREGLERGGYGDYSGKKSFDGREMRELEISGRRMDERDRVDMRIGRRDRDCGDVKGEWLMEIWRNGQRIKNGL